MVTTIDSETIQRRALQIGVSVSSLTFLKSKSVAEKVAEKVWTYLVSNGYGRRSKEQMIQVKESEHFPGTWMVRLSLNGLRRTVPSSAEVTRRDKMAAEAAFKASYTPTDLADTYKLSGRKGDVR